MRRIVILLLIAFAFSPAVETSRSQSSAPGQDSRPNLSGIWEDAGEQVTISDSGGSVTARYSNQKQCRHDGNVTPYRSGFTVSGAGSTLTGTGTVCYYGERDPDSSAPRGVKHDSQVTLRVGADGNTLQGTQLSYHGPISFALKRKCDAENMCAALNAAYQYVGGVVSTVNSGGRPNFSVAEFKENLSRQLTDIERQLDSCDNPSNAISEVKRLLSQMGSNASELQEIHLSLNGARTGFMQSGGPCSGMPSSTSSSGGSQPSSDNPPANDSSSGGNPPSEQNNTCKTGEAPKTSKDNIAFFQLIRVIDQDISKLEQQAKVLRGSRELAAINVRIVKIKQMRAFWQQARTVACVRAEVTRSITAYLEEKKTGGAVGACSKLCTATAAWVASMSGSPLQRLFITDSCSAMCN